MVPSTTAHGAKTERVTFFDRRTPIHAVWKQTDEGTYIVMLTEPAPAAFTYTFSSKDAAEKFCVWFMSV